MPDAAFHTLELKSDYEVDPGRLLILVHPNDYNRLNKALQAGLVLWAKPQTVDAPEVIEVRALKASDD
jgi:hypothetical protein